MEKKLLLCFIGMLALLMLIFGCQNIAVQMSESEKLYRAKCSSCHSVIAPKKHDKEQWRIYVDRYGQNMTEEEKRIVLKYLVSVN